MADSRTYGKLAISMAALMIVAVLLTASTVSAAPQDKTKLVGTQDVDSNFSLTLGDLASSDLVQLLPPELLASLDPATTVDVSFQGKVHVNAMISDNMGDTSVKLHLVWHGTIELQISGMPAMAFDIKVAQLMVDVSIPTDKLDAIDLKMNFHVNGQLTGGEVSDGSLDLKTHVLLKVDGGQITKLKVTLPDSLGAILADLQ